MNYKILAVGVLVVASSILLGYLVWGSGCQQTMVCEESITFRKMGVLVRDNPGLKPGVWYLVYDLPGAPGVTQELSFDSKSFLFVDDRSQNYAEGILSNGLHVSVEGNEASGVVYVKYLVEVADVEPPVMTTVQLYYYNPGLDKDASGNIMCSTQGLTPVVREVPITFTPIQNTIKLLLQGQISDDEKNQGVTTEYPLPGFELKGANFKDGTLTLEFLDPQNKTVGGACRVGILRMQIEATAKQFPEVKQVQIIPEELFQP
jgi:hypothetical protein